MCEIPITIFAQEVHVLNASVNLASEVSFQSFESIFLTCFSSNSTLNT